MGPEQVGEICFHTPFMMKEYLNNPKVILCQLFIKM